MQIFSPMLQMDWRTHDMMGWGWVGMLLCVVLILSIIAALVALTVFLIRRSRATPIPR
jgi:hypothetical protein